MPKIWAFYQENKRVQIYEEYVQVYYGMQGKHSRKHTQEKCKENHDLKHHKMEEKVINRGELGSAT